MDDLRMPAAFTLIELLVVITIIVVLLALLAPTLDRAIYEAELSVCGARLKMISTAATAGAMNHKRYFPDLSTMAAQTSSPHKVMNGWGVDMRPTYGEYLGTGGLNTVLIDPLSEEVDIDGSKLSSHTYGNYWMFFGWQYVGQQGMRRIGDRWAWKDKTYDTMVGDMSVVLSPGQQWNSHPDSDGVLFQGVYQDGLGVASDDLELTGDVYGYTHSSWVAATDNRGLLDMNFAASDTSVQRYYGIDKLSSQTGAVDDRMDQVCNMSTGDTSSMGIVPKTARR